MVNMEKGPRSGGLKGPAGDLAPSRCGSTQKMSANVKVVVRVRPLNVKELDQNNRIVVDVVDDSMLVFDPKEEIRPFFYHGVQQPNKNYFKRANKELKFVFDQVCGPEASNKDVFEIATKDILSSLMEGYNCSVFVYGATGAGKTFTMIGNKENPGITYLTMEHLFDTIGSLEKDREFDIGVSYIEVYNENVFDLIRPSKKPLQLREDHKYGVMVAGLTLHNIKTARELLNMLENGNKNRTQHPTDANAESSRSHAVFQVYLKMSYKTSSQVRIVKLSMIDLAGSERASATGCVGERFKEGANINKSLLSLANCINKLADGGSYIPYRDSKLTRLLKDSLGGNCKTVMIANISPSANSYEDTYNTLKYAARANKIQLSIKKNIVDGGMKLSQFVKINEELKNKVKELEAKLTLSNVRGPDGDSRLAKMNEDLKRKVKELEATRPTARDEAKEKVRQKWRQRVIDEEARHGALESELFELKSRQRVLSLRHRLRARAFSHVAELVHRCSTEAMELTCTEDIPRQERVVENYSKQSIRMEAKIKAVSSQCNDSQKNLEAVFTQALSACPELRDLIERLRLQGEQRRLQTLSDLRYKLLHIEHLEITAFTEYMSDMPPMLKKLFFMLKGSGVVTPSLSDEYMNIMKKAKSVKGISWSDMDCENDAHFKFISNIDVETPAEDYSVPIKKEDPNATVDIVTDSDELTDLENRDPVLSQKRKGTPIKLHNNETIIIDDSLDILDTTKTLNSAKKVKRELDASFDVENINRIQPKELNCTFDLVGKIEALKKQIATDAKVTVMGQPNKRELSDRTNTMARSVNFGGARIVKPVVGRAMPVRRPGIPPAPPQPRAPGFGSSLARDGTPLNRNVQDLMAAPKRGITQNSVGFKAVRARERVQTHPYARPTAFAQRK